MSNNQGNIIIYQTEDGYTRIEVKMEQETVWLSQQQMSTLYQTSRTNVVEHIKHIFEEGELDENSTCRKFRQVQKEGNRDVAREIPFYNLDMIMQQVQITTRNRMSQSVFLRLYKTNCILRHTDIRLPKLFTNGQTQINHLWV